MMDAMLGAAWAAYHQRVATTERSEGNPSGAAFYERMAKRALLPIPQLRGRQSRGGRAAPLPCARPASILSLATSAGGNPPAASDLFDQGAGDSQANGDRRGVESVPVHADRDATETVGSSCGKASYFSGEVLL